MNIGIIVAMDKEYKHFVSLERELELEDANISIKKSGVGKVNAAITTYEMIKEIRPDIILSTGVAGGCDQQVNTLDTVLAQKVCYHDVWCGFDSKIGQVQDLPLYYPVPIDIVDKIKSLNISNLHVGLTVSGDQFVDTKEKVLKIKENFPNALAIDMESAAIAQVCYKMNVPFISIRVISDNPLNENNSKEYQNFWDKVADNSFLTAKEIIKNLINQ